MSLWAHVFLTGHRIISVLNTLALQDNVKDDICTKLSILRGIVYLYCICKRPIKIIFVHTFLLVNPPMFNVFPAIFKTFWKKRNDSVVLQFSFFRKKVILKKAVSERLCMDSHCSKIKIRLRTVMIKAK